jgi:hypothetical protein
MNKGIILIVYLLISIVFGYASMSVAKPNGEEIRFIGKTKLEQMSYFSCLGSSFEYEKEYLLEEDEISGATVIKVMKVFKLTSDYGDIIEKYLDHMQLGVALYETNSKLSTFLGKDAKTIKQEHEESYTICLNIISNFEEKSSKKKEDSFSNKGASSPGNYYVIASKLNVRLESNKYGKLTNTLYKRQKVEVFEVKNGWARISSYYDGVLEGVSGEVARWVFAKYLSAKRPPEEQVHNLNSPVANAIKLSDDFSKYQNVFISVSEKLIESGKCSITDFKFTGGWVRTVIHKPKLVYFAYCGGATASNRIYLDAATGNTFR